LAPWATAAAAVAVAATAGAVIYTIVV
jgi:hypothetical protein